MKVPPSFSTHVTRRTALKTLSLGAAGIGAGMLFPSTGRLFAQETSASAPFSLPPLPYALDALEPAIDAETMEIHHGKHHAGYVKNLNEAVEKDASLQGKSIEALLNDLDSIPEAVRNNGGGHYNHTLFWTSLSASGSKPEGRLLEGIEGKFENLDGLTEAMAKGGAAVFGSGWVWLSLDKKKELTIESTPNQDNPISHGHVPLLGIDVWEHAYYLKYQNDRGAYLKAVLGILDWPAIALRHQRGLG